MRKTAVLWGALAISIAPPSPAQEANHPELGSQSVAGLIANDRLQALRVLGLRIFTTPFNKADGYGDGEFARERDALEFGHRPTLQGNGTFLRVNGLDAQSCNECHSIVSHATAPPELGIGGVGGAVNNAIILPSLIDVADNARGRRDGKAEFNGRFANPPFLFGGGGVELLAKEMTQDLQELLVAARQNGCTPTSLETHGVSFGRITCRNGVPVMDEVEGIGPEDLGSVSPEEALVVRPFGRKGENFSMRDFDRGAMQFHFGIQPVEVVGAADEDGDGVRNEVTEAEMTALHIFDVTNPPPYMEGLDRRARRGFDAFKEIGCADCHIPTMETRSRYLPLAHPEDPTDPAQNVYYEVDLAAVGFRPIRPNGDGGVNVPLFSDLKRHKMGCRLAEDFARGEIANHEFITARLWGIADTEPYLHDGRATTLFEAIELHGDDRGDCPRDETSEAQGACDDFLALGPADQENLIHFLRHLRTPERPNEDIAALLRRR